MYRLTGMKSLIPDLRGNPVLDRYPLEGPPCPTCGHARSVDAPVTIGGLLSDVLAGEIQADKPILSIATALKLRNDGDVVELEDEAFTIVGRALDKSTMTALVKAACLNRVKAAEEAKVMKDTLAAGRKRR